MVEPPRQPSWPSAKRLVLGLVFVLDFITLHYKGPANVLGPAFELLAEIGVVGVEKIDTIPDQAGEQEGLHIGPLTTHAPPHVAAVLRILADVTNAQSIQVEGDHIFIKPGDAPLVLHYMLDKRTKLMAGKVKPHGKITLLKPTERAPDDYGGPVYAFDSNGFATVVNART
jgi:hypothetical protein